MGENTVLWNVGIINIATVAHQRGHCEVISAHSLDEFCHWDVESPPAEQSVIHDDASRDNPRADGPIATPHHARIRRRSELRWINSLPS